MTLKGFRFLVPISLGGMLGFSILIGHKRLAWLSVIIAFIGFFISWCMLCIRRVPKPTLVPEDTLQPIRYMRERAAHLLELLAEDHKECGCEIRDAALEYAGIIRALPLVNEAKDGKG